MEYDDSLAIATPEGVEVTLILAGAASRFVAAIVDLLLETVILIGLFILFAVVGSGVGAGGVGIAIYFVLSFLVIIGYDVLFEVLNSGRTPGKQMNGLRVVTVQGGPEGFVTSAIRNVLRIIDFLPTAYLLGATVILSTRKNQRIGDIVAGTLVVREAQSYAPPARVVTPAPGYQPPTLPVWDTSQITGEEIAAVRQFLERRSMLAREPRTSLANTLSGRLRPKITGVPAGLASEAFLETLVAIRRLDR